MVQAELLSVFIKTGEGSDGVCQETLKALKHILSEYSSDGFVHQSYGCVYKGTNTFRSEWGFVCTIFTTDENAEHVLKDLGYNIVESTRMGYRTY